MFACGALKIIYFQENPDLKGLEYLQKLTEYIAKKQPLKIAYQPNGSDVTEKEYHPYFLKQFNNRWFCFAYAPGNEDYLTNLALDRIVNIEPVNTEFNDSKKEDPLDYFHDVIGVSVTNKETIDIVLRVRAKRWKYGRGSPIF